MLIVMAFLICLQSLAILLFLRFHSLSLAQTISVLLSPKSFPLHKKASTS